MSDNLAALVASADRRRRAAVILFGGVLGVAALFPNNDRAMWVPESETPFVFTAVPEKQPVTYLTIPGADALLRNLVGFGSNIPDRRRRSRVLPLDPTAVAPPTGAGNVPGAAVPEFGELPTELADAQTGPGGILNSNPGGGVSGGPATRTGGGPGGIGGGGSGGSPGTLNDPQVDPPADDPPVDDPIDDDPPVMSPVPEPVSWAMFIFGFGLIGTLLRQRRKKLLAA
ncbi:PEPxxWA-CTERM sorting domain-containing protein [Sphingorhabdus sp. Alg231-15]|uniref:PEPxxWA-CTERM sorting domain-containing protein n=1 Tax=Sphingorhabdus sp. Alg231-15 TaxID=1922222 RepID=UPI000D5547F3